MEFLQIYNRAAGAWGERYTMVPKYGENWVWDKSTDSAQDIEFEILGTAEPKIDVMDWARILHVVEADEPATYTEEGLPLNHNQYTVGAVSCKKNAVLEKWNVALALIEPIERTKGILGETLSYTNQTSKTVKDENDNDVTYVKDPYNHYTALRRWLMVTPANCDNYDNMPLNSITLNGSPDGFSYTYPTVGQKRVIDFTDGSYVGATTATGYRRIIFKPVGENAIVLGQVGMVWWENPFDFGGRRVEKVYQDYAYTVFGAGIDKPAPETRAANISWYNRIKVLDEAWLTKLPFADDTFNELSLYNVLMDKYDSSTGRTPVLYFDIDPATDLPYVNARDEYILKFERQDGFDKPVIQFDDLIAGQEDVCDSAFDLTIKKELGNYATGLVSNISNLSAGSVVEFPAQNLYAVPEVLDDTVRITTSNANAGGNSAYGEPGDNWGIKFPHKVKRITKVLQLNIEGFRTKGGNERLTLKRETSVDLIDKVFEKKQYLSAQEPPSTNNNIMWYEEGGNVLYLKFYVYSADSKTSIYYIEYEPLIDCRISIGDENYTQQVNQSSAQVDAGKFGAFMNNYLKCMNKADIIFGKAYYNAQYYTFANLIGSRVQRGEKTYMITNVCYQMHGLQYYVFFQLNENHFRKNNSYQADQTIREDIAVATDGLKERKSYIKQSINVGVKPQEQSGYQFLSDKRIALSALYPNSVNANKYSQAAVLALKSDLYNEAGNILQHNVQRMVPVSKAIFGNCVILHASFPDNATAGKAKKEVYVETAGSYNIGDPKEQLPMLYADLFGEVQTIDAQYGSFDSYWLENINKEGIWQIGNPEFEIVWAEFLRTVNVYKRMADLPAVEGSPFSFGEKTTLQIENWIMLKDQIENTSLTTGVEFRGDIDIIIEEGLSALSRLMKQNDFSDAHIVVNFYSANRSKNDDVSANLVHSVTVSAHSWEEGSLKYTLPSAPAADYSCVVIQNIGGGITKNCLTINNVNDTIKAQIQADNTLKIYYA